MQTLTMLRRGLSAALLFSAALPVLAADRPASPIIENAWLRALPGELPAAGYFRMRDTSGTQRQLTGADSPAFAMAMLHQSSEQNGQSQMQHVDGVAVPANGTATFAPGGYHLMLMQAKQPLTVGGQVKVTLHFDDGSTVEVPFVIKGAGATAY